MTRRTFIVLGTLLLCGSWPVLAQRASAPPKAASAASTDIVNLNTATAVEIATLPGIGPKTADLIIQYRTKNGAFKKVEEIMNVRGVGEKSFLKLKSRITVAPAKGE